MPDSVGLYVNNPVTQMGYRIGRVATITPSAHSVRVDFTADRQRSLPTDVKAVIRSTSILADRQADRPMEWDIRNGVIQRYGRKHGIAVPISDVVVPLLAAGSEGPG